MPETYVATRPRYPTATVYTDERVVAAPLRPVEGRLLPAGPNVGLVQAQYLADPSVRSSSLTPWRDPRYTYAAPLGYVEAERLRRRLYAPAGVVDPSAPRARAGGALLVLAILAVVMIGAPEDGL